MTRLQRLGLAVLLIVIIVLLAILVDVLRFFTVLHVPLASVFILWTAVLGGTLALLLGE